jgi:excisionase family DNA binding protein
MLTNEHQSQTDIISGFEPLLNLQEAARLLGMHWKTLEILARKGTVPAVKLGKRWRFRASSINDWLTARFQPGQPVQAASADATLKLQPRHAN